MKVALRAVVLWIGVVMCQAAMAQAGLLPWPEVKTKVADYWSQAYPGEKVLGIEQKGGVEYTATKKVQETTTVSDWWGTEWITTNKEIHGSFARQVALVNVERVNKSRVRFQVAALYRGEGKAWKFEQIAVGPVTELGKPGDPAAPGNADAERIFKDAWGKTRPDFTIESVKVLAAPKLGQSGERRWLSYLLAINATATDKAPANMRGKKFRCAPADYASVLQWDNGAWVADGMMIGNVNETRDCNPAN